MSLQGSSILWASGWRKQKARASVRRDGSLEGRAAALPCHVARWPPRPGTQLGLQGSEQCWALLTTGRLPWGLSWKESACNVGDLGWEDPLEKGTGVFLEHKARTKAKATTLVRPHTCCSEAGPESGAGGSIPSFTSSCLPQSLEKFLS